MRVGCSCRLQLYHTWIELARLIIGESTLSSARYINYFETVWGNATIARIAHLERIHAENESLGGLKVASCQSTIKTDENVRLSILRKSITAHIFMYLVSSVSINETIFAREKKGWKILIYRYNDVLYDRGQLRIRSHVKRQPGFDLRMLKRFKI